MKRKSLKTAATFGAAMTAMYAAPNLNADIVSIGFNPGSLAFGTGASANVSMTNTANASLIGTFSQWNDSIGKTLNFNTTGLASWGIVGGGSSISSAATFSAGPGNIGFTTGASSSVYIGFRSTAGNVGWFTMNLGGAGGAITWGPGEYGTAGETITVGGTSSVPEPSGLALLALGAIGVGARRRRNKAELA